MISFKQFKESTQNKGTYVGVKYNDDSSYRLIDYAKRNKIPNHLNDPEDVHSTLVYSDKYLDGFKPKGDLKDMIPVYPDSLAVWPSSTGTKNALVLKLKSDDIVSRHNKLHDQYGITWPHADFNPHVTLSYNVGDLDSSKLEDVRNIGPLMVNREYSEDLDKDWSR